MKIMAKLIGNKKGDERILSFYWFVMFIIIAIGVVSGVINFYGNPLDIREKEASILADKVIECFVDKGIIKEEIDEGNFEERCGLDFADINYKDDKQYFAFLKIGEAEIKAGNMQIEPLCYSAKSRRNKSICSTKKLFVLNDKNEFVFFEVKTGVLKIKQNVK